MGGAGLPDDLIAGHQTQTWLATADQHEIKPRTGGFWYHKRASRPHPSTLDPAFQDELIRKLEGYAGVAFPLP